MLAWCILFQAVLVAAKSPIILVPGMYSSRLFARMTSDDGRGRYCKGITRGTYDELHNRFQIWFSAYTGLGVRCFNWNFASRFDKDAGYQNQSGMEVWVEDFGGLKSIDTLSDSLGQPIYHDIIMELQKREYVEGRNLHGAPYDFRMAPRVFEQSGAFYPQLHSLIENTVRKNGRAASVVAHSMGCAVMQDFLVRYIPSVVQFPSRWKNTFIEKFVALAPAWGGSAVFWQSYASGYPIVSILPSDITRPADVRQPVSVYLSPCEKVWKNRTIVTAGLRSYNASGFLDLLSDIGIVHPEHHAPKMLEDMRQSKATLCDILQHPGVQTHVLYGVDTPTVSHVTYGTSFSGNGEAASKPSQTFTSGDGTVTDFSAEAFKLWVSPHWFSTAEVHAYKVPNVEHSEFLHNSYVIGKVLRILGTHETRTVSPWNSNAGDQSKAEKQLNCAISTDVSLWAKNKFEPLLGKRLKLTSFDVLKKSRIADAMKNITVEAIPLGQYLEFQDKSYREFIPLPRFPAPIEYIVGGYVSDTERILNATTGFLLATAIKITANHAEYTFRWPDGGAVLITLDQEPRSFFSLFRSEVL